MHHMSHIFHLVEQKYEYSLRKDTTRATHVPYFKAIQHFISQLEEHIRANNTEALETELSDILRDYCNLLHTLEKEWYINQKKNIFDKCLEKYEERVSGHRDESIDRTETKTLQSSRLFHKQVLSDNTQ